MVHALALRHASRGGKAWNKLLQHKTGSDVEKLHHPMMLISPFSELRSTIESLVRGGSK